MNIFLFPDIHPEQFVTTFCYELKDEYLLKIEFVCLFVRCAVMNFI